MTGPGRGVAGLILAAGLSSRMGSPKPLLTFGDETFVDRLVGVFARCCDEVIVVLGHEHERVRASMRRPATVVVNHDYRQGMGSSLRCGLAASPANCGRVLFHPVDQPGVRATTVALLADWLRRTDAPLVLPTYEGRTGHPVGCGPVVINELLALAADAPSHLVTRRHRGAALLVQTHDAAVVLDVDDAAAYRNYLQTVPA